MYWLHVLLESEKYYTFVVGQPSTRENLWNSIQGGITSASVAALLVCVGCMHCSLLLIIISYVNQPAAGGIFSRRVFNLCYHVLYYLSVLCFWQPLNARVIYTSSPTSRIHARKTKKDMPVSCKYTKFVSECLLESDLTPPFRTKLLIPAVQRHTV